MKVKLFLNLVLAKPAAHIYSTLVSNDGTTEPEENIILQLVVKCLLFGQKVQLQKNSLKKDLDSCIAATVCHSLVLGQ